MNNVMPDWGQNDLVVSDQKEATKENTEKIFPITFSNSTSFIEFKENMENLISFFTKHSLPSIDPPSIGGFDLDDVYSQKGKIPFPKQKDLPYDEVVGLCGEYGINPLNVTSIKVADHDTDKCLKVITIEKLVF
jgi:hypothetical protein